MECEYNQEGFCVVEQEFPEWTCPLKDAKGHCTAKSEDLAYCCPDCNGENCDGRCTTEESCVVPKTNPNKTSTNTL
jgi:hypothetical protein